MICNTKKPPGKEKKSIAFSLSLYNGYFEGSSWPNKNCWEVTFSKMQHTHTEIYPLKINLVHFHMQISSRQSLSEQCFSQVKYKKEIKAIGPGRILNHVYFRVRKMMGAFYFA